MINEENASYIVIKAHDEWEYVIKEKDYLIIDAWTRHFCLSWWCRVVSKPFDINFVWDIIVL